MVQKTQNNYREVLQTAKNAPPVITAISSNICSKQASQRADKYHWKETESAQFSVNTFCEYVKEKLAQKSALKYFTYHIL